MYKEISPRWNPTSQWIDCKNQVSSLDFYSELLFLFISTKEAPREWTLMLLHRHITGHTSTCDELRSWIHQITCSVIRQPGESSLYHLNEDDSLCRQIWMWCRQIFNCKSKAEGKKELATPWNTSYTKEWSRKWKQARCCRQGIL